MMLHPSFMFSDVAFLAFIPERERERRRERERERNPNLKSSIIHGFKCN